MDEVIFPVDYDQGGDQIVDDVRPDCPRSMRKIELNVHMCL